MDRKNCFYPYEPVPVPRLDMNGNIVGYEYPPVLPLTLEQSDPLRKKEFPNELGCSADPENVPGFQATLDIINAHRNLKTSGLTAIGNDDCSMVQLVKDFVDSFESKS